MYVCMYVWQALDASKVGQNSLWADENDADIMLDEDEFNKLFVDRSIPHTYIHTYIRMYVYLGHVGIGETNVYLLIRK